MAVDPADSSPSRPYSSPDQVPAGAEFRSNAFRTGLAGDPDNTATATTRTDTGLTADSLQFNAQVPGGVRPLSVLQPIMANSGNLGMSAADASRRLADGTYLGSGNGNGSSFEKSAMLRLSGRDTGLT